ncbi:MAG: ATP-dependent RecD-like DNA helicase [Lachnospiraceae bacterium]|nr:ATP-dependent RecD-like DNA helicase [Lachnospiraceae bacterium]
MAEALECVFEKTIYQREPNDVTIALYHATGKSVIVTGSMLPIAKKVKYVFYGEWVNHPKYGKQFKMTEGYDTAKPSTKESIKEYLASGTIRGIGQKTAERIVEMFGDETLDVMKKDIFCLLKVKGLTKNKIEKIKTSFDENFAGRETIVLLGKKGISPKIASKVYQKFKDKAIKIIEEQPYRLCMVQGITFPVADSLGPQTEAYELSYDRFFICANYVLAENENNGMKDYIGNRTAGSLSMTVQDFGNAMLSLLRMKSMTGEKICEYTIRAIKDGHLKMLVDNGVQYIYRPGVYRIERRLAENIARLTRKEVSKTVEDIDAYIKKAENELRITLSEEQRQAVLNAYQNNLSLIIGPPGTGKTTVIQVIVYIFKELNKNSQITLLAPTGRASRRITETTNMDAFTIHSCLGLHTEQINDVNEEEEYKIEEGLVVVDEMSMLDARVAYQLFASIRKKCKIILCGDDDQLQSVGAGAVLRDMITSEALPVTTLKNIYRQDAQSLVYRNSHNIREGKYELEYGEDFMIYETDETADMEEQMIAMYLEKIKEHGKENVMLLSPFKEHDAGVYNLNSRIQKILNPDAKTEYQGNGKTFRTGDLVMQLKNNETQANGDIGVVTAIHKRDGEQIVCVKFENDRRDYFDEEAGEELNLAYAYTVHKAQGSEAKCVITCMHDMHSVMRKRNIFYTAVTRAKQEVIVFGQKRAVEKAIQTADKSKRNTGLKQMLKQECSCWITVN